MLLIKKSYLLEGFDILTGIPPVLLALNNLLSRADSKYQLMLRLLHHRMYFLHPVPTRKSVSSHYMWLQRHKHKVNEDIVFNYLPGKLRCLTTLLVP